MIRTEVFDKDKFYAEVVAEFQKEQATDKSSLKSHQRTVHEGKKVIRNEVLDKDKFYAEVVAEFQKEQSRLVDIDVD